MKKLLVISFTFLVAVSMSSCTSSDANKDNGQTAASTDENMPLENGGDFGKDAGADGAIAPADGQAATGGLDDVPLDGSVDATKTAATPDAGAMDLGDPENEFPADVAKSQKEGVAPTDDKVFADAAATPPADTTTPPPDVAAATPQDTSTAPPIENTQTAEVTPAPTEAPVADASAAAPSAVLPYEKIKTEPFEKKGVMLNRVYLARKGDTAKAISQKIYGSPDHVKDLKAWNSSLKNHAPRVGDKVYYSSPKDPQDAKMAVYYEDMGVEAQHYTTQAGDDIRKVSTKLLGHKDSWKEIYATNASLENKMGKVPEGMDIRFWPSMNEAAPVVAQNPAAPGGMPNDPMNNPAEAPAQMPPQAAMPPAELPPQMPPQAPQQQPTATPQQVAAAQIQQPPPPPPEMPQQAPPPPPQIERPTKKPASPPQNQEASSDPDQTMMFVAVGLLTLAALAAFVVIKRQRAKSIDISQQTQV